MATAKHNHTAPAETQPSESTQASFDKLLSRLLGLVHHFQCADQRLWNFNETPPEYQAAATVLHDATEALDRFYDDLDSWHTRTVAIVDATDVPPAALDAQGWLNIAARHLGQARVALNTAFEEAVPDSEEEHEARDARESVEIAYGIVKTEGARP